MKETLRHRDQSLIPVSSTAPELRAGSEAFSVCRRDWSHILFWGTAPKQGQGHSLCPTPAHPSAALTSLPRAQPERASNTQSRDQTVQEQCKASKRFQTLPNIPAPAKSPSEPDTAGHEVSPAARGHSSCSSGMWGVLPDPSQPHGPGGGKHKDSPTGNCLQQLCSPLGLPHGWGHKGTFPKEHPTPHEHPRNRAGKEGRVHGPTAPRAHSSPAQASCIPWDGAPTGRER